MPSCPCWNILDIVLKHARMNQVRRVHSIRLAIGEMSDLRMNGSRNKLRLHRQRTHSPKAPGW